MLADEKPFQIELADYQQLLRLASTADHLHANVAVRRQKFIAGFIEMVGGKGGFWGWGRGRPGITSVVPIASIPIGFAAEEWSQIAEFSLSNEGQKLAQIPIFARLTVVSQATVTRSDLINDELWYASNVFNANLYPIGLDDFLTSVRYFSKDSWHCLTIFRELDRGKFGTREKELLHLAMTGVAWLEPKASESIPPDTFSKITPRQRVVMLYLLDGVPRKQIAAKLGLTLHTVNDHVKSLYEHFGVQSATELSARFLKSI
jgi:DNA-binding CsgD family transcriptional regulator